MEEFQMKNKKKSILKPIRIPLPKHRNQAFKSAKDYDRKNQNWKKNSDSFVLI